MLTMTALEELSSGPDEILAYARRLIKEGSEASLRIAFLLIDDAIEIMAGTYLQMVTEPDRRPGRPTEDVGDLLVRAAEHAGSGDIDFRMISNIFGSVRSRLYHGRSDAIARPQTVSSYLKVAYTCLDLFFGTDRGQRGEGDTLPYELSLILRSAGNRRTAIEQDVIYMAEHELEYGMLRFEDALSALVQTGRLEEEESEVLRLGLKLSREDEAWYRKNRQLAEWFVQISFRVNDMMQEIFFGNSQA